MNNALEGYGMERPWPNLIYYQRICLGETRGKPRKSLFRIAGLEAEILTRDLLNKKQQCHLFGRYVCYKFLLYLIQDGY
jgi:hypothetical protein